MKNIHNFLKNNNIENYKITPIIGDASVRKYFRVTFANKSTTKIIMDCSKGGGLEEFCNIDKILRKEGFYAPEIFCEDLKNKFLLLEDLGNTPVKEFLISNPKKEEEIYLESTKILIDLHQIEINKYKIAPYDTKTLLKEVNLFIDYYLANIKKITLSQQELSDWRDFWINIFSKISLNKVICLRDYHSENLMITNKNKIALIDFQDALIGSPAYDLQSLLEDIRRNIDSNISQKMFNYYLENSIFSKQDITNDYKILSLQRNIKIIGIFARLSYRDGKHKYLKFIPKLISLVKNHVEEIMEFKIIKKYL